MTFAENLKRLCEERRTSVTAIIKELKNGQSSYVTAINKKGSIPNQEELLKLAKLLNCSVMDFFADEDEITPTQPKDEDEEDLLRIYRSLSRRGKHEFMAMVYEFENRQELEGDKESTTAV